MWCLQRMLKQQHLVVVNLMSVQTRIFYISWTTGIQKFFGSTVFFFFFFKKKKYSLEMFFSFKKKMVNWSSTCTNAFVTENDGPTIKFTRDLYIYSLSWTKEKEWDNRTVIYVNTSAKVEKYYLCLRFYLVGIN